MSQENVEFVRKPLRVRAQSSRTLDQRLALRFPWLGDANVRLIDRLPPKSRIRQAAVWRAARLAVEAYNRRDLDAFMATYAPDLALYAHPDRPLTSGQEQARREYGTMFENVPNLHVEIANRIVQGSFVIDHEVVTGLPDGKEVRAVAIYEVREGKIQNVWFIQ